MSAQEEVSRGTVVVAPVARLYDSEKARATAYARRLQWVQRSLNAGIRATTLEDSLTIFSMAVDTARTLVVMAPNDPDAHYLYAVALGQRLELSGTREKIRLGEITRSEAEAALALDPEHAGAHHVLGRLNAATMRMGFVARFVARRLLGARALAGATWDKAEYHFSRARDLEPWNPRHSMELGVLYVDTGRIADAMEVLEEAIAMPQIQHGDSLAVDRAVAVRAALDGPER